MATFSSIVSNVAGGLLKQRKPEVLQDYAAQIAGHLQKRAADMFDLKAVHQYQGDGTNHCSPTTLAMVINFILG